MPEPSPTPTSGHAPTAAVRIDSIAAGGDGVGRLPDGRAVFVPRSAAGELVEVELTAAHARWARGRVVALLEPSPDRRQPPCPFAGRCGGCPLEHLAYPAQLAAKARIVADALTRVGGVAVNAPEVVGSPAELRYRNRISVTLRRLEDGVVAGFHALDDPDRIVDVDGSCLLPETAVAEAWDRLRAAWGAGAELLPRGRELRLTLRASAAGAASLLVEGGEGGGRAEALRAAAGLAAVWRRRPGEAPRLVAGAAVDDTWAGARVSLAGSAFLQVNRGAAELLEEHVLAVAGPLAGALAVDAYCGVGLLARRLLAAGARVVGIERDRAAADEARRIAPEAEILTGSAERHLAAHLPAELVIVDPPREGLGAAVAEALAARPPARLVYVSCDPATLARDLRRLGGALRLGAVRCFDLFPQTAQVETVAVLEPPS